MFVTLNTKYSASFLGLNRDDMLKRHKDIPSLLSEYDAFRERVEHVMNQTDVVFKEKEESVDYLVNLLAKLTKNKDAYEKKAYENLVANDLTNDKLKLAELTKIVVGKFSGVMGVGDDFFTFKFKFLKAYANHP